MYKIISLNLLYRHSCIIMYVNRWIFTNRSRINLKSPETKSLVMLIFERYRSIPRYFREKTVNNIFSQKREFRNENWWPNQEKNIIKTLFFICFWKKNELNLSAVLMNYTWPSNENGSFFYRSKCSICL